MGGVEISLASAHMLTLVVSIARLVRNLPSEMFTDPYKKR